MFENSILPWPRTSFSGAIVYFFQLTSTNFGNEVHLTSLLETLCLTFREFIAHEQIENKFIMKKLKNRMRALSIQNTAVCNCHKVRVIRPNKTIPVFRVTKPYLNLLV